jgi:hypothetical protein
MVMLVLILGSLRYTTYQMHLQDMAARKKKASTDQGSQTGGNEAAGGMNNSGTTTDTSGEPDMLASLHNSGGTRTANPSYVSLG